MSFIVKSSQKSLLNRTMKVDKFGFTLMEVLVSMSIFVLATLAALSIYSATLKASQKTTALTRVQKEAQLIMEVLAKKIRTSRVDYGYYGDIGLPGSRNVVISNPETELALVDPLDDNYVFKQSGNYLVVLVNGGADKIIPATNVNITDIRFYISPPSFPFEIDIPPSSQPYVTIVMTVSSIKAAQGANLIVQQTVLQRSGGIVK